MQFFLAKPIWYLNRSQLGHVNRGCFKTRFNTHLITERDVGKCHVCKKCLRCLDFALHAFKKVRTFEIARFHRIWR